MAKHAQASADGQRLHSRRETRYFATWKRPRETEEHGLPPVVRAATGQTMCPIGDAALRCEDAVLAAETCEELFTPASPHIALALSGVEIVGNGSGSHHQACYSFWPCLIVYVVCSSLEELAYWHAWHLCGRAQVSMHAITAGNIACCPVVTMSKTVGLQPAQLRKLHQRVDLMRSATAKAGGVYLYANQRGCDGGRLYYDGCACIAVNGEFVAQARGTAAASQSLDDGNTMARLAIQQPPVFAASCLCRRAGCMPSPIRRAQ